MKLTLLYIILLVSCLIGTQQLAVAGQHTGKSSFALVEKQLAFGDHVLGIEDENDEDELTRKFTSNARWLAAFTQSFLICATINTNCTTSRSPQSYCGGDIYILHCVLRI